MNPSQPGGRREIHDQNHEIQGLSLGHVAVEVVVPKICDGPPLSKELRCLPSSMSVSSLKVASAGKSKGPNTGRGYWRAKEDCQRVQMMQHDRLRHRWSLKDAVEGAEQERKERWIWHYLEKRPIRPGTLALEMAGGTMNFVESLSLYRDSVFDERMEK